jgi:hypothetical protein
VVAVAVLQLVAEVVLLLDAVAETVPHLPTTNKVPQGLKTMIS